MEHTFVAAYAGLAFGWALWAALGKPTPRWPRRKGTPLPRGLARAALPEPAVPPGAVLMNPEPLRGTGPWATCVGCHALRDESMPLRQRMRLSNTHADHCPDRYSLVTWK